MIVCNRCGKENQDHYKFCLGCGAELTAAAGRLAALLTERGVGAEDPVAIHLPRGPHYVVAMLAVLAAGAMIVPLDPGMPAERIAAHLDAGRDVALLAEGDPLFYSSYMHMHTRLTERFDAVIVPGVTSVSAASAALSTPLVQGDEVLTILPGTLPPAELTRRLADSDAAATVQTGSAAGSDNGSDRCSFCSARDRSDNGRCDGETRHVGRALQWFLDALWEARHTEALAAGL